MEELNSLLARLKQGARLVPWDEELREAVSLGNAALVAMSAYKKGQDEAYEKTLRAVADRAVNYERAVDYEHRSGFTDGARETCEGAVYAFGEAIQAVKESRT